MEQYIPITAVALLAVLLIGYFIKTVNQLVVLRNRVRNQQAQIHVQLKRRTDLIPNLVEIAKGYGCFERDTLESLVKARAFALETKNLQDTMAAGTQLSTAVHRLLAVGENYPDLKSNANYMQIQTELSETEDQVAKARQFYNDTVMKYNNKVQMFPASVIAALTRNREVAFLEVSESDLSDTKLSASFLTPPKG